ncbi:MAG: hypothetical protein V1754_07715 [Pseudomonadota bacterium]
MGWLIKCTDTKCGMQTWAGNIVDLINDHLDSAGWLLCQCGKHGYVEKSFELQESGETWEPYLRGIIPLGSPKDTYQPFVFLVSYEPSGPVNDIWFSYYKDLRATGGRLKLGYGPGGPPVLGKEDVLRLLRQLRDIGCFTREEIDNALL